MRCQRHEEFPDGHPFKYYLRPMLLNFGVRKGTGGSSMVWPLARDTVLAGIYVRRYPQGGALGPKTKVAEK